MAGPLPPAIGGMATVVNDIAASSLAREVELLLFDTAKRTPEGRSLVQAVGSRFALWRAWWRTLSPAPATVAHIHTCSGLSYFLDGAYVLLARLRGVPVVLHIHGARFDRFLDGLSPLSRSLARCIARRATRVVVLSAEWKQNLRERLPGAHVTIIENGVAEPLPFEGHKMPGEISVLFLGNLCQRKGVWDLVDCAQALPPGVRVVLVGGEEDPGIAKALQGHLVREGLQDRVKLVGPVVGEAKMRWLRGADMFVLPSYAEGVPISMLEAAAVGLPLIVTPVGGIASVLSDGEHAIFVQPGDREALVKAISHLAQTPSLRSTLGAAARAHVLATYGIERSAEKYLHLYRALRPALLLPKAGVADAPSDATQAQAQAFLRGPM
jgi:glycosyltransferase involved in cell wall biosynthesis